MWRRYSLDEKDPVQKSAGTGASGLRSSKKRILAYGDSNTYGWDPRDFFGNPYAHPWPAVLAGYTGCNVINCGEPGRELPANDEQLAWMKSALAENSPVDLLIIMLGTNDVLNSLNPDAAVIAERVDRMLQFLTGKCGKLKSENDGAEIPVLLVCPPELRTDRPVHQQVSRNLSAEYRKAAERYGIFFADASALALPLAYDGVHLTEKGHQLLAEYLAEIIKRNT